MCHTGRLFLHRVWLIVKEITMQVCTVLVQMSWLSKRKEQLLSHTSRREGSESVSAQTLDRAACKGSGVQSTLTVKNSIHPIVQKSMSNVNLLKWPGHIFRITCFMNKLVKYLTDHKTIYSRGFMSQALVV